MTTTTRLPRPLAALAAAAFAALLLAGCTGQGGGSSSPDMPAAPGAPLADEPAGADTAQDADGTSERSVVTTGWLQLTVEDPLAAAADASALVERAGGRVDHRSETPGTETQEARASLVLRIPADELDGTVAALRELGHVDQVSLDASDVTVERQDLEARIDALTASVARLQQLLASAATTADLIEIESELTTRQAELDGLTAQRELLVDQIDYATVSLELVTEGVAPSAGPGDFWSGLAVGWDSLVAFTGTALVALGVALPWLGVLVVLGGLVVGIVLLATRRRPDPEA
ncbi:DUF4349 domain-containing protein [Agromyces sp. NPDC060279]|uniref:DUF4349 domain-containing protein n=1 Tax=Agromyces sp. NPDC060279 TaxID=3347092 RepID=UPI00365236D7